MARPRKGFFFVGENLLSSDRPQGKPLQQQERGEANDETRGERGPEHQRQEVNNLEALNDEQSGERDLSEHVRQRARRLRPITLNQREACLCSPTITPQLNTPPASESQKPGLKNVPSTQLPAMMRMSVTAHALRAPSVESASSVAIFARPGLAQGNGRGSFASNKNMTRPKADNSAVRVKRCVRVVVSKSDGIEIVLFFAHEHNGEMIRGADEHLVRALNTTLPHAHLLRT